MALKVRINGQMQQITGPGNYPVTFVNGVKKKLVKGVTFINGAKKVLWDSQDLKIDIISDVYNLFGREARVIWASNNKVILSTKDPYNRTLNISRWNIENKSNPIVENTVALGSVVGYSSIDTTDENMVYYAVSGEQSVQQININPDTAEITASNPLSFSDTKIGKLTGCLLGNSDWLGVRATSNHGWDIRLNTNLVESFGYSTGGASISEPTYIGLAAKRDATSFLLYTVTGSLGDKEYSVAVINSSGITVGLNNANYYDILVDTDNNNNIVLCGYAGFGLYSSEFAKIAEDVPDGENICCYLLGRIRDYYYVIQAPSNKNATDRKIYLRVYNTLGELFEIRQLSLPEFTATPFVPLILTVPHISQTGALGFWFNASGGAAQDCVVVIQGY